MDATEAAKALVGWATEVCPTLKSIYDHEPQSITSAVPFAMAAVADEEDSGGDSQLGISVDEPIEQAVLHIMRARIELCVDPSDPEAAAEALEGYVNALAAAMRAEARTVGAITLGGRVQTTSPFWRAEYLPPFLEFEDGTRFRRATFALAIAELI